MKLKFKMHVHVLTIEDDLYGYKKKLAFTLSENKIMAEKNNLVFWQKKIKWSVPNNMELCAQTC